VFDCHPESSFFKSNDSKSKDVLFQVALRLGFTIAAAVLSQAPTHGRGRQGDNYLFYLFFYCHPESSLGMFQIK
jgi:hypothetical protein